MTKYMAAGAFATCPRASRPSRTLGRVAEEGLAQAGTFGGKLYGVPYYASSRVVTYRRILHEGGAQDGAQGKPRAAPVLRAESRQAELDEGFSPRLHRGHRLGTSR